MFFCIQLWGTTLVSQVWNKNKMFRSKGQKNACFWSKEYAIRKMFRRKIIDKAVIVRYWNVSKCFLCFITPPIYWSLQLSLTLALLAACLTVHSMLNSLQKSFTCNLGLGKYICKALLQRTWNHRTVLSHCHSIIFGSVSKPCVY